PELAGPIAEVLDTALSPDPAKRFATADALAKALRAALIRTRTPGAIETVVGARVLEADESDVELAAKRDAKKVAAPVARAGIPRPGALKGIAPAKPLRKEPAAKSAIAPPATAPVKAANAQRVEPPAAAAAEPAPTEKAVDEEALEFERLSGLLEVSEAFAAAAPPPRRETAEGGAPKARRDESLEFERLSGLLE